VRKIDLTNYQTPWRTDVPEQERSFAVKESLAAVLFNNPGMNPRQLLKVNRIAEKIEAATGYVLLENEEYDRLMEGLEGTSPTQLTRDTVELVRRVLEAPVIDVVPKEAHKA